MSRPRRGSASLHRAGKLALVAAASLLLLELGVRLLRLGPPVDEVASYFVRDAILTYRTRPGGRYQGTSPSGEYRYDYRHNSQGFRDDEHPLAKPEGVFRVLALGDSFTYGAGADFEDTWLERLEDRLAATRTDGPSIEVIKAGVPRYFPEPERLMLEHYGLAFEPDLVLVGFVPNDVMDTHLGLAAVVVDEEGFLRTAEGARFGAVTRALFLYLHTARIPISWYVERTRARRLHTRWPEVWRDDGLFEESWLQVERELAAMAALSAEAGAGFAVVHIPVSPTNVERLKIEDVTYPGRRLRRWADRAGVVLIDSQPAIQTAQRDQQLYWIEDPHCNAYGYGVIADVVFEAITTRGLVPGYSRPRASS